MWTHLAAFPLSWTLWTLKVMFRWSLGMNLQHVLLKCPLVLHPHITLSATNFPAAAAGRAWWAGAPWLTGTGGCAPRERATAGARLRGATGADGRTPGPKGDTKQIRGIRLKSGS